jgi:hypothetical protein
MIKLFLCTLTILFSVNVFAAKGCGRCTEMPGGNCDCGEYGCWTPLPDSHPCDKNAVQSVEQGKQFQVQQLLQVSGSHDGVKNDIYDAQQEPAQYDNPHAGSDMLQAR